MASSWEWHTYFCWDSFTPYRPKRIKHFCPECIIQGVTAISGKRSNLTFLIFLLLILKQTIPQEKALDISFNLTPQKWAWHYQEGGTPTRRKKHILLNLMGAEGFWLLVLDEISTTPFLSYSSFQGVKLKLRSRAFCWGIVCFSTINSSFRILIWKYERFRLLHPVECPQKI